MLTIFLMPLAIAIIFLAAHFLVKSGCEDEMIQEDTPTGMGFTSNKNPKAPPREGDENTVFGKLN